MRPLLRTRKPRRAPAPAMWRRAGAKRLRHCDGVQVAAELEAGVIREALNHFRPRRQRFRPATPSAIRRSGIQVSGTASFVGQAAVRATKEPHAVAADVGYAAIREHVACVDRAYGRAFGRGRGAENMKRTGVFATTDEIESIKKGAANTPLIAIKLRDAANSAASRALVCAEARTPGGFRATTESTSRPASS